jgi:carboxyl-terminal processing protease
MRVAKILITIVATLLVVAAAFAGGYVANDVAHPQRITLTPTERAQADQAGDLERVVIEELQGRYYKKVDVSKLETGGVNGTLKSLDDPYTVYMDPKESQKWRETLEGSYSGIGAGLEKKGKKLLITWVFDDSPAKEAGLKAGDAIVTVDGEPTADKSVEANVTRIKGPEGTQVILEVRKQDHGALQKMTLTRRQIHIPVTRTKIIERGGMKIGYIQLYDYSTGVGKTIHGEIDKLESQGAQTFILDLRYNGGGYVGEAVNVTSDFLEKGAVVTTVGLHSPKQTFDATGDAATDKPLVVLVNHWTASSSEITSGALQDNARATIMGTQTFGKGLVQELVDLPNGATLKLTTAIYLTPDGRDINKKGITPDVKAADDLKTKPDEALDRAVEYLVSGH